MTTYDFDQDYDRRASDSIKWRTYGDDVLPMWVADMDFRAPPPVIEALRRRVAEGIYGYAKEPDALREAVVARLDDLYAWKVAPEAIVTLPGLVSGLNIAARAVGEPGDGVLANTPVYGPFLTAPALQGRTLQSAPQRLVEQDDGTLTYEIDYAALDAAVETRTRLFFLCSPHNPTGRAWSRDELGCLAEMAERRDLVICSDEIHCDLLLDGARHIPLASLSEEIARRTITLMSPSKTFNLPGLGASLAIIPDKTLRDAFTRASAGIVPHLNVFGQVAMLAAYMECEGWLEALRAYLTANRDFVVDFVRAEMPGVRVTRPQATYLAWLDCREAGLGTDAHKFFLSNAKVAVNDGAWFGEGGEGFVRLNFGTTRALLAEGLGRMAAALKSLEAA